MRPDGLLTDPRGAARGDHVCWVYDTPDSFAEVARACLEEGLARGERLLWVAGGGIPSVPLPDVECLLARGALQVLDVGAAYAGSGSFTPEDQLAFYDAATRAALTAGYTGLRVIADVSDLAADEARRPELVRWEHLADAYIASGSGMVALCAYRGDLPAEALADVATVHPLVHVRGGEPAFRIWFDGDALAAAGSLDTFDAPRLEHVLDGTRAGRPQATLDLSRVDFVDVGGCRTIARWARRLADRGTRLELVGCSRVFRRMWRVLGFDEYVEVSFRERVA